MEWLGVYTLILGFPKFISIPFALLLLACIAVILREAVRNQIKWTPKNRKKIEQKFGSGEAYLHDDHDH